MDLQGKPSYQSEDCPLCKKRSGFDTQNIKAGFRLSCQSCEKELHSYLYVPSGFQSVEIDHWHFKVINGINGLHNVMLRLCWDCYIKEWDNKYKDEEAVRPTPPARLD